MGSIQNGFEKTPDEADATTCRHGLTRSAWGEQHATEEEWCQCAAAARNVYKANIKIDLKLNLGSLIAFVAIVAAIVWLVSRGR